MKDYIKKLIVEMLNDSYKTESLNQKYAYRGDDTTPRWEPLEKMKHIEVDERGNEWFDDSQYINKGYECIWACPTKQAAKRYGNYQHTIDVTNSIPVVDDGDGGCLYVRKKQLNESSTEGNKKLNYYLNQIKTNQYQPLNKQLFNLINEEGWVEQLSDFYKKKINILDIVFTTLNLFQKDRNDLINIEDDIVNLFNEFDIALKEKQKYPYNVLDMIDYNKGIVYIFKYVGNTENQILTLYHGTTQENAKILLLNGWQGRSDSGGNMGNSKYLYLSSLPEDAMWFAQENGGNAIIEIKNIPLNYLQPDPEDEAGYSMEELLERMKTTNMPSKFVLINPLNKNHFSIYK